MNVTGLKKQFFRVKQNLDQNLGRAERTEVLNDDELEIERKVEQLKLICQNVVKKVSACLYINGAANDVEKRLKKVPEASLSSTLIESSVQLGPTTPSGQLFQICGDAEGKLANERYYLETDVENKVIKSLQDLLDVDIPSLQKLKKQLNTKILDMDANKARYTSLVKQSQTGGGQVAGLQAKIDAAKDDMEDSIMKCEQIKDQLSTEMYTFVGKESEIDRLLYDLIQAQVSYHKRSLQVLDSLLPTLQECIDHSVKKPVFGLSLEEHLTSSETEIASVIEECISVLYETGLDEEGLFRIAGSASKIKKLKAAFNYSVGSGSVLATMDDLDLHVIASVLKLYLRELPEPLMTFTLYNDFMQAVQKPGDQRSSALHEVIKRLPVHNYENLRYLVKFLAKLSENSAVNKMSPSNLAVVMGPNLMWAQGEQGPNMLTTGMQSTIVELLIANAGQLFPGEVNFSGVSRSGGIASHPTFTNLPLEMGNSHHGPAPGWHQAGSGHHSYAGNGGVASNDLAGSKSQIKSQSSESLPSTTAVDSLSDGNASPGTLKRKKPPAPQPPAEKPAFLSERSTRGESVASGLASAINPLMNPTGVSGNGAPEPATRSYGGGSAERLSGDFSERPDRPPSPKVVERPKAPPPERPSAPQMSRNTQSHRVGNEEGVSTSAAQPRLYPTLSESGEGSAIVHGKIQGGTAHVFPPGGDNSVKPQGEKSHSRQLSTGAKPPRPVPPPPPKPRGESRGGSEDEGWPRGGHSRGSSKGSAHDVSYL